MRPLSYIVPRLVFLCLLMLALNAFYTRFLWERDLKKYDAHLLLELREREDTADIFYLAESSNFSIHPKDTQRMPISYLLNAQIPERVATLNKGAYHAGLFYDLIRQMRSTTIHTVVVTMNLRTLNQATIHGDLETALQKQDRLFKPCPPLLNRFLLTLNAYDDTPYEERNRAMWVSWAKDTLRSDEVEFPAPTIKAWCALGDLYDANGNIDPARSALADHYVKAYAFQITEDNPRVRQFDRIADYCKKKGYRLVFNLLAENVEYAEALCGPSLPWLMRTNRDFLVQRYTDMGVLVVDNLEAVAGVHYTEQDWTSEHYDQVGRQQIADRLAAALSTLKEQ